MENKSNHLVHFQLPEEVEFVLNTLHENNYQAYIVGGSVRDLLLDQLPKDYDITTNALVDEILTVFEPYQYNVIETGKRFGTITLVINLMHIEITTYRLDGVYENNRHPKEVTFTSALEEDLKRRDFTVNSMAYNHEVGLIDLFDGHLDLALKIIRCVGDAKTRLSEDALRIMRAFRFKAQLGFQIDSLTLNAIKETSYLLHNISIERIRDEFNKIIIYNPSVLLNMHTTNVLNQILPEFSKCFMVQQENPYHVYNVAIHSIEAMKNINADLSLRLTMLLHDIGKPLTKMTDINGCAHFYKHANIGALLAGEILARFKYDNLTTMKVIDLIYYHDVEVL